MAANRADLATRCQAKVTARLPPTGVSSVPVSAHGVPLLIDQLITTLRAGREPVTLAPDIGTSATRHGGELMRGGFTVDQVVHSYGDLCQALTELARERDEPITVDEFHTFNLCLDNAIAEAVTEFTRVRDRDTAEANAHTTNERLGVLAHELRNQLNSAVLAFQAIKSGSVAIGGATGTLLDRSLHRLRDLIDCSLADVRLTTGLAPRRERISVDDLVAEVHVAIVISAVARGLRFSSAIEPGLVLEGDRQMISSALANLLQNAVKLSRRGGTIVLTARAVADRIAISVEDSCGGMASGTMERIFRPFAQPADDRAGLGLSISRRAIEGNGGKLEVHNLPGLGCIFTMDLRGAVAL
ncbi:MAG: HAMP domain-containing sensor histidine kinase [Kofleriaceae bacterium]